MGMFDGVLELAPVLAPWRSGATAKGWPLVLRPTDNLCFLSAPPIAAGLVMTLAAREPSKETIRVPNGCEQRSNQDASPPMTGPTIALPVARRGARPGQALIELSFIIVMMVTMAFALIEFGRAFHAYLTVAHAARDGARVGMDHDDAAVNAAIAEAAHPLTPSSVAISQTAAQVSVTVTYQFETPAPIVSEFWGGGPLTISRTMVGRIEDVE